MQIDNFIQNFNNIKKVTKMAIENKNFFEIILIKLDIIYELLKNNYIIYILAYFTCFSILILLHQLRGLLTRHGL